MRARSLRCVNCQREYSLELHYHCDECGFPLEVTYEGTGVAPLADANERGVWRFSQFLPPVAPRERVSLGEGNTPLLPAAKLGDRMGLPGLFVKNEGQNPTGSFKDRPMAVGVGMALTLGLDTVAASSTGNAGASLAAYAAAAGMRALVFVTGRTPPAKLAQICMYGARPVVVRGSLSDVFWLVYRASQQMGWMNLTSTFLCAYTVEGDKTPAYEIYEALGRAPDWVVVPVSVGPLLVGIFKGFLELKAMGLVTGLPRMVAAQAAACGPIARAFARGEETVSKWDEGTTTIAGGIADPLAGYERDGTYALRIVRTSGGFASASTDPEIRKATMDLAATEGIFGEPTGAVSVAALDQIKRHPEYRAGQTLVCMLTGHGLKQVGSFESAVTMPDPIEPTMEALSALLSRSDHEQAAKEDPG
ncbi:MAG TPA: threonine synthase [Anaerolineales bacterium]|nr:threonine synthase [Anaerolineales bacterium]